MAGYCGVTLIGNLGADPKLEYTDQGHARASLRLAVNNRKRTRDGYEDVTNWYTVRVFGRPAENCNMYLRKGSRVMIVGTLIVNDYKTKEGLDRYALDVNANDVTFLDTREEREQLNATPSQPNPPATESDIPW